MGLVTSVPPTGPSLFALTSSFQDAATPSALISGSTPDLQNRNLHFNTPSQVLHHTSSWEAVIQNSPAHSYPQDLVFIPLAKQLTL